MAERAHPDDPNFQGTMYEARLRERYAFCLPYIQGKHVLDVPCGVGWGSSLLSGYASLTGLDIDAESIAYARAHFPGIEFAEGPMQKLPLDSGSFDVLLCLEGLEHVYLSDAHAFLGEAHRVLRSGGTLILTAPLLTNQRHSTNPYHLYEFDDRELVSMLERYFVRETLDIFQGTDSLEVRFVGRRRDLPDERPAARFRQDVYARVCSWLPTMQAADGFRFAAGAEQSLIATCCGMLLLEGAGRLDDIPEEQRAAWASYLQRCQDAGTGLFLDPLLARFPVTSADHDVAYLSHQMSYFAIQALGALGRRAPHPLRFLDELRGRGAIVAWLERLDWSNPWLESNRVMFVLAFLIYQAEIAHDSQAPALFHSVLDWLDQTQDAITGLWGIRQGATELNAVAAAYHFIPFYEYVHRPVGRIRRIIDVTISLQQPDGLFGPVSGGGACEDMDAIDILATLSRHTSYRGDEIKRVLIRGFWAIWNLQNEDGGFGYAGRATDQTYRFSSWVPMEARLRQSDAWSSWFRPLALATIAGTYPEDVPQLGDWRFRRWPALGYHRFSADITGHEREVLPLWVRPTASAGLRRKQVAASEVSVIIPCYNLGRYLHESVESVLAQTWQPVELIIVDDGSTDAFTQALLESFDRPGARVIRQTNQGLPVARNHGIQAARGRYICCLDADDRLRPEFFAQAVAILDAEPEVGFVTSHYQMFDDWSDIVQYASCAFPELLVQNRAMVSALFRRDAWARAGGYCETLGGLQDWDLWISILELGYRAVVIPEVLFEYRARPDSMFATTRRPENYGRLLEQIVDRHRETYHQYLHAVVAGMGVELAQLMQNRDMVGQSWESQHAHIKRQQARIDQLEQERDRLWDELQRVGGSWESQHAYIQSQQARIDQLEQERDRLWDELQRVGGSWESQHAYILRQEDQLAQTQQELQRLRQSWQTKLAVLQQVQHERDQLRQALQRDDCGADAPEAAGPQIEPAPMSRGWSAAIKYKWLLPRGVRRMVRRLVLIRRNG